MQHICITLKKSIKDNFILIENAVQNHAYFKLPNFKIYSIKNIISHIRISIFLFSKIKSQTSKQNFIFSRKHTYVICSFYCILYRIYTYSNISQKNINKQCHNLAKPEVSSYRFEKIKQQPTV